MSLTNLLPVVDTPSHLVRTVVTWLPSFETVSNPNGRSADESSRSSDPSSVWALDAPDTSTSSLDIDERVTVGKTIDETDIRPFADATGDMNSLHFDEEYAAEMPFDDPIVHGMLVAGLIWTALGQLPGTVVYLSQDLAFQRRASPGERVTCTVEVVESLGENRYRLQTIDENGERSTVRQSS
jgi:acyl dehydratase